MNLAPAARAALLAAAGVLAVAAVHQAVELAHDRDRLVETAVDLRIEDRELLRLLDRTEDPYAARATLARAALVLGSTEARESPGAPSLRARRLDAAERLAREALGRRPASWQAALVAGAAPFVRWSLDRDPRLLQEYRRWEEPLSLAVRLAPGQSEPVRYLASAYLELWPALSEEKRDLARSLVAQAFEEPATFRQLVEPWLEVSGTDLRPIPEVPWAWTTLRNALARRQDWQGYCRAWNVHRRTLHERLAAEVATGERQVEAGRLLAGRTALFQAAAAAPADRAFAGLVDRALRTAPYGPGRPDLGAAFAGWLEWALDLGLRGESPLSQEALGRLRAVVTASGTADPRHRAAAVWTYLAAGDLRGAEAAERQSQARWSEPWAPYWIEKARLATARGEVAAARRALAEVHPEWQDHPAYRLARRALAEAEGARGLELGTARTAVAELSARRWPAEEWSWRGSRARLEPLAEGAAGGLAVTLADVPPGGAAVAVRWDGAAVGCHAVTGPGVVRLERAVAPGLHLLEVETLGSATGRVAPGPVRLLSPDR